MRMVAAAGSRVQGGGGGGGAGVAVYDDGEELEVRPFYA